MTPDELHEKVVRQYSEHINPYLAKLMHFAGFGVETYAEGCYVFDHEGRKFLDCLGGYGVYALGHRHPVVIDAVKAQLDRMPMSAKAMFNERMADLAEKLAEITPSGLELCFFSNSGTEAVEAALKLAKGATRKTKIVSTEGGYHGKTLGALAATGREKYRRPFDPLMPGVEFVEYGNVAELAEAVDEHTGCVIVEPLQGEGGIHLPPEGYMTALREICDRNGVLMIADEVQTGLGRTGRMFGCDHEGVSPDIMCLAKALGGGVMPIGATVFTRAVGAAVFAENPLAHTSTFGGNPLACAAALAAIAVIEAEDLPGRAEEVGLALMEGLRLSAAKRPDLVKEVRGRGLMIGVEFTMDDVGELAIAQMVKRGLLAAYTLNNRRVIRFEPPLTMTKEEAAWAAQVFDEALAETADLLSSLV